MAHVPISWAPRAGSPVERRRFISPPWPRRVVPDIETLRLMLADLERTVRTQITTGEQIDEKAARIIGWNGLLLGLFVTAASIAFENGASASMPWWIPGTGGLALLGLLVSVWFAVRTYRATEYRIGLEPADVVQALEFDIDEHRHLQEAIHAYSSAHDDNKASIDKSSKSFQVALFSFFSALLFATISARAFLWVVGQS